jgi:flavin-binding protein dodecin
MIGRQLQPCLVAHKGDEGGMGIAAQPQLPPLNCGAITARARSDRGKLRTSVTHHAEVHIMSVAKVSEISATSTTSFEDAIKKGLERASKTLRNIRGAWVKEQHVRCNEGVITEYQVNMMVTFVLDD